MASSDNHDFETVEIHPEHLLPFDSLPDKKRVWPGEPGSREEGLGRLVLLTPEVVASAASTCVRTGRRVSLGWELTKLEIANFGRSPCRHEIVELLDGVAFDDIYTFNPQQSSQWDGLRHFSQPLRRNLDDEVGKTGAGTGSEERLFYGGVTKSEIKDPWCRRIGIHEWAKQGICGRGVLLDFVRYADRKGLEYSTFGDFAISLSVLLEIATEQRVEFKRGDILFVRIGVTREWDTRMTATQKQEYAESQNPRHSGVQGTEEMLRWLWDTGFSAVASDAISFEVYPPKESYERRRRRRRRPKDTAGGGGGGGEEEEDGDDESQVEKIPGIFLHEYLLSGWGMPIGELFDLEDLSKLCSSHNRWEFFVSSSPFNMPGGVSSPPNCIAIF
ncbi:uncharacterized protein PV06_03700 [Exophiala oligosperma]|uniref:Cyclase n=1 Tax=Exophiala oligosperma TaxID=215243 RepID=A0A0D2C655_9EURO|nr:uncharacterized protein PV06_03700 [Exophiala oligosperma]KIW45302.1 hypothetical protein PV06_03700 [Exophiala oligosperma]